MNKKRSYYYYLLFYPFNLSYQARDSLQQKKTLISNLNWALVFRYLSPID